METDFNKHFKYRNNFNKFQLPEVKEKAPRILKKKIDTSPFKRTYKSGFYQSQNNFNVSKYKDSYGMKSSGNFSSKRNNNNNEEENLFDVDENKYNELNNEILELEKKYGVDE